MSGEGVPTIRPYNPTLRERAVNTLGDLLGGGYEGNRSARKIMNLADWTPAGIPFALYDAGRALGLGSQQAANDAPLQGAANIGMGALQAAMAVAPGPMKKIAPEAEQLAHGITAYHGSPHNFDRFDISAIGTGEGNQTFGHGLYFAESPKTADSYRTALSLPSSIQNDVAREYLREANGDREIAAAAVQKYADETGQDLSGVKSQILNSSGHMYQVKINANPEHFLDWDKSLAQQSPQVQRVLASFGFNHDPKAASAFDDALLAALQGDAHAPLPKQPMNPRGQDIYRKMQRSKGSTWLDPSRPADSALSAALHSAGIPGIKYFDAGSRDAGVGTRNFVVFDPSIVDITHKNGVPLSRANGGAVTKRFRDFHNQINRKRGGAVPLDKSPSKAAFRKNVKAEYEGAGKPLKQALAIAYSVKDRAKRAHGGQVAHPGGLLHSTVAGRTDHLPLKVKPGSYVIPADIVSGLGQGNTMAGSKVLDHMFPGNSHGGMSTKGMPYRKHGGAVPIMAAGGEYIITPEALKAKFGDADKAAKIMDAFIVKQRAHHVKTLSNLPRPARADEKE